MWGVRVVFRVVCPPSLVSELPHHRGQRVGHLLSLFVLSMDLCDYLSNSLVPVQSRLVLFCWADAIAKNNYFSSSSSCSFPAFFCLYPSFRASLNQFWTLAQSLSRKKKSILSCKARTPSGKALFSYRNFGLTSWDSNRPRLLRDSLKDFDYSPEWLLWIPPIFNEDRSTSRHLEFLFSNQLLLLYRWGPKAKGPLWLSSP